MSNFSERLEFCEVGITLLFIIRILEPSQGLMYMVGAPKMSIDYVLGYLPRTALYLCSLTPASVLRF